MMGYILMSIIVYFVIGTISLVAENFHDLDMKVEHDALVFFLWPYFLIKRMWGVVK